jgi:hypothetical protein
MVIVIKRLGSDLEKFGSSMMLVVVVVAVAVVDLRAFKSNLIGSDRAYHRL